MSFVLSEVTQILRKRFVGQEEEELVCGQRVLRGSPDKAGWHWVLASLCPLYTLPFHTHGEQSFGLGLARQTGSHSAPQALGADSLPGYRGQIHAPIQRSWGRVRVCISNKGHVAL